MASGTSSLVRQHLAAVRALLALTVVLGIAYPLAVTAVGQLAFHHKANGSLVSRDGTVVGSSLLGQRFTDASGAPLAEWFQPRPSAAGDGYDPTSSGASNLGPENPDLVASIRERLAQIAVLDHVAADGIPPDALTASGSGLDPDISPEYAYLQVGRVAAARGLDVGEVHALVESNIIGRDLGFIGEPHVNVLQLNLTLAELTG